MESELRSFLDSHGVYVDLDNQLLMYKKSTYDISYAIPPFRPTHNIPNQQINDRVHFER